MRLGTATGFSTSTIPLIPAEKTGAAATVTGGGD